MLATTKFRAVMAQPQRSKIKSRSRITNPLLHGIKSFIESAHKSDSTGEDFSDRDLAHSRNQHSLADANLPKRYTIYEPMLLLPSNFPTHSPPWHMFYLSLSEAHKHRLFSIISSAFHQAGQGITHIALNAPIDPTMSNEVVNAENHIRSPINLQPLYGGFGPLTLLSEHASDPAEDDFQNALWVETSQLSGVKQVWAPRWTMFSRGNIREKARILGNVQHNPSPFPGLTEDELGQPIGEVDVVDMYIGIGYFAIPYLKKGVRRVFGWEINGWSVEGLRRGCEKNNIVCMVVRVDDPKWDGQGKLVVDHVVHMLAQDKDIRCVVFQTSNRSAGPLVHELSIKLRDHDTALNVRHCNLGLLPTSAEAWEAAVHTLDSRRGGWLHVHENAEIIEIEQKQHLVVESIGRLVRAHRGTDWTVVCEHTEMVKTYAPGVGHFVFDIKLSRPST